MFENNLADSISRIPNGLVRKRCSNWHRVEVFNQLHKRLKVSWGFFVLRQTKRIEFDPI